MQEIVRRAAETWNGHEVDWAGDGAFLAFSGARNAIAAAAEIQRALSAEPWPTDGVVRVRMGMHTGEPERLDHGYLGLDVHVAARICAAGHGDQVVVSQATREVAGEEPMAGLSFRPLGRHRLKDVPDPLQLFQLVGPGLVADFPPLRTLAGATLPALHHRLIGRDAVLTAVQALLTRPDVRLVTVTGPGGAGKSRLALEVAGDAAVHRPVHLVGLATISDPELVPAAVARAVGVRESPGRSLAESLSEALTETRALLLLDNLEHLPGAAIHVRDLLDRIPDIKVLATSRVPLHLSAEHVVPLDPLRVDDASTLFAELAAARGVVLHEDALPSVQEICRRLDGLPLAIELVAARLVVLPPAHILGALDDGLALKMEGPVDLPERQRTLRATIEWSYQLLSEPQRELHGALAVFAGGCTLSDARALVGSGSPLLRDLESLVAWSLLRSDVADGEVRLSMLETVREHAIARLDPEALDDLRRRHADRFVALASAAGAELAGPDQGSWFERLELELDNIRAALDWLLSSGRVEDALRTVSALGPFWRARGHIAEARRWLARALEEADGVAPEVLSTALWWSARQAAAQDDLKAELPLLERALELFRELGWTRETAFALGELGWIALQQGERERAEELCEEALAVARATGDADAISAQLNYLADIYSARGDHLRALTSHEEALALRRTLADPMLVTNSTYNLGIAAFENGEIARARNAFEETHALASGLGDILHSAAAEFMLAEIDLHEGDADGAERRILNCLAVYTELENDRSRAECLVVLGGAAAARGSLEDAARLFGAAERLRGDSPLNRFERPVLDRYGQDVEERLGEERGAELRAEGARLGADAVASRVVSSAVQH
jgi:predicted ATPase